MELGLVSTSKEGSEIYKSEVSECIGSFVQLYSSIRTTSTSIDCQRLYSYTSSLMREYPGLVDHRSIADLTRSVNDNDVSKYLSAMDDFTSKFMSKSLQYVCSLKIEPYCGHMIKDPYPEKDGYIVESNNEYGRLQYMCDYFKYYILECQFEFLATICENLECKFELMELKSEGVESKDTESEDSEYEGSNYGLVNIKEVKKEVMSLLDVFDKNTGKEEFKLPSEFDVEEVKLPIKQLKVEIPKCREKKDAECSSSGYDKIRNIVFPNFDEDEYGDLVSSISRYCLPLISDRRSIRSKAISSKRVRIRHVDLLNRDMLIKYLIEIYLFFIDKFKLMAYLVFKDNRDLLTEKFVLPVPKEVAEVVHQEIETKMVVSNYFYKKRRSFFCEGKFFPCDLDNITKNVLERLSDIPMSIILDRMKGYFLRFRFEEEEKSFIDGVDNDGKGMKRKRKSGVKSK
ncbi:hypothetical protein [Candidatus Ichthyocystis hellenicum]|uniref:hypothetical protein n=1 Tax=Candidatus Ichthyocystis hellenicum TaxID=1561003 RepID=UPI000B812F0A|nr:hypothetical protein [Candidatus Ichthyocystis hellenicum]